MLIFRFVISFLGTVRIGLHTLMRKNHLIFLILSRAKALYTLTMSPIGFLAFSELCFFLKQVINSHNSWQLTELLTTNQLIAKVLQL